MTTKASADHRNMQDATEKTNCKDQCIKLLEGQLKNEKREVPQITTQLEVAAAKTPTSQENSGVIQQVQDQCYEVLAEARQQKTVFKVGLENKDALIEQHVREFERLQDQCQRAERENDEHSERIDELTEIQNQNLAKASALEKPRTTVIH